jgi:hypothetical protein
MKWSVAVDVTSLKSSVDYETKMTTKQKCWRSIQTGAVARRKNSSYYSPRTKRKLAPGDAYI